MLYTVITAEPVAVPHAHSFRSAVLASTVLQSSFFEKSLACTKTHVRSEAEGTVTEPVAAFHSHFKLGTIWQHGEVLIAYRTVQWPVEQCGSGQWNYHLDVFDRIGVKKTSAMKAFFMTSEARKVRSVSTHSLERFDGQQMDVLTNTPHVRSCCHTTFGPTRPALLVVLDCTESMPLTI
eukprot:SAG31_NODE_1959_length_6808_cov_2.925771_4_plen_179_part_00